MHVDYEKMMEMVHSVVFDIFTRIEKEIVAEVKLQDVGYHRVKEGVGCFSFNPSIQHNLTEVLCEHFGKDSNLSMSGKYQAAKMAITSSTTLQLCLEDVQRSEFVAFLDYYSQFCLKLEQQMEQSVSQPVSQDIPLKQRRAP